ncbi:hypothetical protein [Aliiroseovarius sp. PrR006]|uniref:hypothetical protein n=1 Tax=Aliiroseovarius sp. PrR006 TaxID=2706883 RepID=UPI001943DB18|nr:hypothetical protein [Aliiroseovarius sp. PrR006]
MVRLLAALSLIVALAGCGGADNIWASDQTVADAVYRHDGPPTLTLFTVISKASGSGAHSALMINGSQRLIFDPAGTFHHPNLPERHDVIYGMTDPAVDFYIDYHARVTYDVVRQDIVVSPQVAEMAKRAVEQYGAVPKAHCGQSVSAILRSLPGFETIPQSYYPKKIMNAFGARPGVRTKTFSDDDPHKGGQIRTRNI